MRGWAGAAPASFLGAPAVASSLVTSPSLFLLSKPPALFLHDCSFCNTVLPPHCWASVPVGLFLVYRLKSRLPFPPPLPRSLHRCLSCLTSTTSLRSDCCSNHWSCMWIMGKAKEGIFDKVPGDSWHSRVENHVTLWLGGFSGPQGFLLLHTASLPDFPTHYYPPPSRGFPAWGDPAHSSHPACRCVCFLPVFDSPAAVSELVSPFLAFCSILFRVCPSHTSLQCHWWGTFT